MIPADFGFDPASGWLHSGLKLGLLPHYHDYKGFFVPPYIFYRI